MQSQKAKSSPSFLKNFADFVPRLGHENNRFLLVLCLLDVILIPIFTGIMLQSYFVIVFLLGLLLSFLAFMVGPATKSWKVALIALIFFSLTWIALGFFVTWIINQLLYWFSAPYHNPISQLDYKVAIVFGAISLLCGLTFHLFAIFNTDYVEEKVVPQPIRKRSKR